MHDQPRPSVETAPGRRSTSSVADRALLAIFGIAVALVLVSAILNFAAGSVGLAAPSPSEDSAAASPRVATPDQGAPLPGGVMASWEANALDHRGRIGVLVMFECDPGGVPQPVWGTDVYTDDSSVCTAAVHAGDITLETGGSVWIRVEAGQPSYDGSPRNGIVTQSYPAWEGSFTVVPGL